MKRDCMKSPRIKSSVREGTIPSLRDAFASYERVTILGRGPSAIDARGRSLSRDTVLITGPTYAQRDVFAGEPVGVLVGTPPDQVDAIARRYHATPSDRRPVLMYAFLPVVPPFDFAAFGLDPISILPALTAAGLYEAGSWPYPTSGVFLLLLAAAIGKHADVAGIDLYRHVSGKVYAIDSDSQTHAWPQFHSLDCELSHLRRATRHAPGMFNLSPELQAAIGKVHPDSTDSSIGSP